MSDPRGTFSPMQSAQARQRKREQKRLSREEKRRSLRTSLPDWPAFFPRPKFSFLDYARPIIDQLSRALIAICREHEIVKTMANVGIDVVGNTPEEFTASIRADLPIVRSAVEAAGLLSR